MTFILIVLSAVLTNHLITTQTYGIYPFLGVSKKTSSAVGMGLAVTVVTVLSTLVTYPVYTYVMVPLHFDFLEIIFFIFIIAALAWILEAILKKVFPLLYSTMGIYPPLITTNCAVLGVAEALKLAKMKDGVLDLGLLSELIPGAAGAMNMGWALLYALFAGIGFTFVMILMSSLRERMNYYKLPEAIAGFPIAIVTACFICMAFSVFGQIAL